MPTTTRIAMLLGLLALVVCTAPAHTETVACTAITSLPYVITVQGIYCLTGNLSTGMTSGSAIDIQTNNVVLDLNGWKLGGLAAGVGTHTYGIHALDRQNITIKNGTIRGFHSGIRLENAAVSQGHVIEDIRADQNTFVGIDVQGNGDIIRNNQVVATGGTTTAGPNADAYGIVVLGSGPRVLNNDVMHTFKQGTGTARGIFFNTVTDGLAINNRITDAGVGISFAGSNGKYRDNVTASVTTPYDSGTDIGNNN